PPPRRVRLAPVLGASAPAVAFGHAVGLLGDWFAQEGTGRPASLPWAIAISPLHRPPGYENYATFAPLFIYQLIWDVTAGAALIVAARRWKLAGDRVFALGCAAYAIAGFGVFWLGIAHMPVIAWLPAGVLGDVAVLAGAVVYLLRTRRAGTKSVPNPRKPALERDSPVM
ncbi:MAG TPA: prolipoprotein diacylglyceryl transferase family protein, partial [Trebonia sp.]|nr:prolipoprotein diacylglyceryl transferase family protein [Trebonia sp.]